VIDEIEIKSNACRNRLDKLGEPRAPVAEQRLYLLYISQSFQSLVKAAVDGTYNDPFFENAKTELGYQKRIRAVMQNLNHQSCIDSWVKYTTPYLSPVVVSETECCNNADLINTTSPGRRSNCRPT
jgi:site-specific DNA-adenine methylase